MIHVDSLEFGYRTPRDIFSGFSWSAEAGDAWSILGPSGCGKTTLLYLLAGLRQPSGGTVSIDSSPVVKPRRDTGLILQDHGLLPWATAEDNAALGLRIRGVPRKQIQSSLDEWLDRLGIADVRRQYPAQLSGGQRQRVAIVRALMLEPRLLLMDEPFASLDALTREDLQDTLLDLSASLGAKLTLVLVTHDVSEAVLLGRHVMVMSRPPISEVTIVENPSSGSSTYRRESGFYEKCLETRAAVDVARGIADSGRMVGQLSESR